MKPINEILNYSQESYETMLFEIYIDWCTDFCRNYQSDLQRLVANNALNAYFLSEYSKLEKEFIEILADYISAGVTTSDIRELYTGITSKIFNRFSKPLIAKAKKTNIYNYE